MSKRIGKLLMEYDEEREAIIKKFKDEHMQNNGLISFLSHEDKDKLYHNSLWDRLLCFQGDGIQRDW